jgi:two-component system, sensor histidine kinase PdtaS
MEKRRNKSFPIKTISLAGPRLGPMLAALFRVVLPYLILGAAWILFSDQILYSFIDDPIVMIKVSTFKGWAYVLITGILLFILVYSELRRQAALEAELREGLKEKGALLYELNHRVKNNLQVLSSILSLEADGIEGDEARELNNRTKARIQALSLAHERLFDAGPIARVDLGAYLQTLWAVLLEIYDAKGAEAAFSLEEVLVGPMEAPPLGLFAAEAISNAIRFGACADGNCRASIAIARGEGNTVRMTIRDEGRGFSMDDAGLGLRLMDALAAQLRGKLERYNDGGAVIRLSFALSGETING